MAPFDGSHTTYYRSAAATIALPYTISEIKGNIGQKSWSFSYLESIKQSNKIFQKQQENLQCETQQGNRPGIVYTSTAAVQPNWVTSLVIAAARARSQTDPQHMHREWRRAKQYLPMGSTRKREINLFLLYFKCTHISSSRLSVIISFCPMR